MTRILRIDAWFDFICPWCLIGKRQLARALEMLADAAPEAQAQVHWHGVQLLPHMPAQGVPFAAFYRDRLGSAEAVRGRQARVMQAAGLAGVRIDFARIALMPNTADAHRLFQLACREGSAAQAEMLLERLYAAHFVLGESLCDGAGLLAHAEAAGLPARAMLPAIQGGMRPFRNEPGFGPAPSGVPHLVFDQWLQVGGAQPAEALLAAMQMALQRGCAA